MQTAVARQTRSADVGDTLAELAPMADCCPGYGMCRIDFLGTGVCPVAARKRFAAYHPQGRMQVISAFSRGLIPATRSLVDIARACEECGSCDKQCYFVAGLRPLRLFRAFKRHVRGLRGSVARARNASITRDLAAVTGGEWCSDDPAILASYARARSPLAEEVLPSCVVLPGCTVEVSEVIRVCNAAGVPYVPRGAATSLGGALSSGVVIDLTRMDTIRVDRERCCATVGPGAFAFNVQRAAAAVGMRANVAEPAACVCANVICTNLHSFYSYAYGVGADHFIDGEFVSPEGRIYRLRDEGAPNPFFRRERPQQLGICTEIVLKLHPVCPEEDCALIPCGSLGEALDVTRDIARRGIGIGLGVVGTLYLSMFAGLTAASAPHIRETLERKLGIGACIVVLGDRAALRGISALASPVLDRALTSMLLRALPALHRDRGFQMLTEFEGGNQLFRELFTDEMRPMLEMALRSSGAERSDVDEDLRPFFDEFYARPESSDTVWLNDFRILPARMGRGQQFVSRILYFSLDNPRPVLTACDRLGAIGDQQELRHGFGYLLPFSGGTRAVMEYDYYFNRTNAAEVQRMKAAMRESSAFIRTLDGTPGFVCSGETVLMQGLCRPESYLYGR